MSNSIIICADTKEQTEKRNAYKKYAKEHGAFVRVDHNTVILKNGAVSFVVEEASEIDDEHLPPEAFAEPCPRCGSRNVDAGATIAEYGEELPYLTTCECRDCGNWFYITK